MLDCPLAGRNDKFQVLVNISDCNRNTMLTNKFVKSMKDVGGFLNLDQKYAKMNMYVMDLIRNYEALPNDAKREAAVIEKLGYHEIDTSSGKKNIYAVGREQLIPVSKKTQVDHLELFSFSAKKTLPNLQIQFPLSNSSSGYLNAEILYHGDNAGSILSLHGYVYLAMQREGLEENFLHLGPTFLFGVGESGKSSTVDQLSRTFPRLKPKMEVIKDCKLTVPLLTEELSKPRPPIIQDPPNTKNWNDLNGLFDCLYQGTLPKTSVSNLENEKPQSGLIVVFPNEQVRLDKMDKTSLTKGVFLYHRRHNGEKNFKVNERTLESLDDAASSIFASYLKKPKWTRIKRIQEEKIEIFKDKLSEKFDMESEDNPRILSNYALILAGTLEWVSQGRFNLDVDVEEVLTKYYVEVCIPKLLEAVERWNSKQPSDIADEEEDLRSDIVVKLQGLSLKEMLHNVSFLTRDGKPAVAFAATFWKTFLGLFTGPGSLNNVKFVKRIYFLSKDSPEYWFKLSDTGETVGKASRLNAYLVPQEDLPDDLFLCIVSKLKDFAPSIMSVKKTDSLKKVLDDKFADNTKPVLASQESALDKRIYTMINTLKSSKKMKLMHYLEKISTEVSDDDEDTDSVSSGNLVVGSKDAEESSSDASKPSQQLPEEGDLNDPFMAIPPGRSGVSKDAREITEDVEEQDFLGPIRDAVASEIQGNKEPEESHELHEGQKVDDSSLPSRLMRQKRNKPKRFDS